MSTYYLTCKKQTNNIGSLLTQNESNILCISKDLFSSIRKINQYILENIYCIHINDSLSHLSYNLKINYNYKNNLTYTFLIINNKDSFCDNEYEFEIIKIGNNLTI